MMFAVLLGFTLVWQSFSSTTVANGSAAQPSASKCCQHGCGKCGRTCCAGTPAPLSTPFAPASTRLGFQNRLPALATLAVSLPIPSFCSAN